MSILLDPIAIKKRFEIKEADLIALRQYGEKVQEEGAIKQFLDEFYNWMETLEEYNQFFSDKSVRDRVKNQQQFYWAEFFNAEINEKFLKGRHRIGEVHAKIKLPLVVHISAISFSAEWWLSHIQESGLPKAQIKATVSAFTRLIKLDLAIVSEVFSQQSTAGWYLEALGKVQCLVEFNMDGSIISANENFLNVMNYSISEIQGKHHNLFVSAEHRDSQDYKAFWDKLNRGQFEAGEFKLIGKNGKEVWMQSSYNPILDLVNRPFKVVKFSTDISEQKYLIEKSRKEMEAAITNLDRQNTLKTSLSELFNVMRGELNIEELASNLLNKLSELVNVHIGAFYLLNKNKLELVASYAYTKRKNISNIFELGEGLVGQCAREKKAIVISNIPEDYIKITSGLGETAPRMIMVIPIIFEKQLIAVLEIGTLDLFTDDHLSFLQSASENIAISLNSASARSRLQALLEETQAQQEELRSSNEELEEKTRELERTQQGLKLQTEELRVSNEELADRTKDLELQKNDIESKNKEIEITKQALERRAKELEIASKYKSEFLANMSHELRTPLNSLLILAKELAENEEQNLTPHQLEAAKIIHEGGIDLLTLINDILDLSKVEAGKLDIHIEPFALNDLVSNLERQFSPLAKNKDLQFKTNISPNCPRTIFSDSLRTEQILKNLLSNAFKFTSKGSVTLAIEKASAELMPLQRKSSEEFFALSVVDTGIGIPEDKQREIFEAFQQADGSTSRKYGGTGLGLTISRQLAKLLGGELHIRSKTGEGSTFTLYLPCKVEGFSNEKEFIRDLNTVNHQVKTSPPAQKTGDIKAKVLIVEDNHESQIAIASVIRNENVIITTAQTGQEAEMQLKANQFDLIILDLNLPDTTGFNLMKKLSDEKQIVIPPVIIYTGRDLSSKEHKLLKEYSNSIVIKGVNSAERLLDETQLFLHSMQANLPANQKTVQLLHAAEVVLKNRKILLVDDDMRNAFALSSALTKHGLKVIIAENGKHAIEKLEQEFDIEIVLMDIMMPIMNGFEAMTYLRKQERFQKLPIIALTAKAMLEDRVACLNAGANDYLTKPIDMEKLVNLIKVWLFKEAGAEQGVAAELTTEDAV
ncbi:Autoinducer 2 sensor kinase/phosphatase LuxQ [Legionella massiliensis]|uniref:histidine kinase n=1 Tax=Legionella massiliensis TaxID=1034943 RepID=A0A078KV31_9GAMM|nr:response regulator [Legionella massiliensis]CDZ76852.1 Autoinducer 2 sensor kinase/phosphatase LuxQ [Legionella massiliensis]CEE12590.1 Autoinducer 2 sensor kinase/phosphatase LuxQ [Legionella massiliensis]